MARQRLLPSFAADIRREHNAAYRSAQTAIEHAIECGRLLIRAKSHVKHGEWIPWIEQNLPFGRKQATKYMRLTKNADALPHVPSNGHLTIDGALAALSPPKPEPADNEPNGSKLRPTAESKLDRVRTRYADLLSEVGKPAQIAEIQRLLSDLDLNSTDLETADAGAPSEENSAAVYYPDGRTSE